MILDNIIAATRKRVEHQKGVLPLDELQRLVRPKEPLFPFERALQTEDISFICEVKKASPSKGVIATDFPYLQIAMTYEKAGAHAISVLTEPAFFLGDITYLQEIKRQVQVPILRKDFILDPYQLYESSVCGADAVLLICSILDTKTIREYLEIADCLGLSCLVEAHNEQQVRSAIEARARIIGVNNRDLNTFTVDLNNSIALRALVPDDTIFVSESGIRTPQQIQQLRDCGVDAVLIGEQLMRSEDKKQQLDYLKGTT